MLICNDAIAMLSRHSLYSGSVQTLQHRYEIVDFSGASKRRHRYNLGRFTIHSRYPARPELGVSRSDMQGPVWASLRQRPDFSLD